MKQEPRSEPLLDRVDAYMVRCDLRVHVNVPTGGSLLDLSNA
jgi:hypothetical protein